MKKFFSLIVVLLLSFSVQAQDSSPTDISISATLEGGCFLSFNSTTALTWSAMPLPTSVATVGEPIIADEGQITCFFSYRLATGHRARLVCDTAEITLNSVPLAEGADSWMEHTFAGDVVFSGALPATGIQQEIYTSATYGGSKNATVDIMWKNLLYPAGLYETIISYTVLDHTL